MFEALLSTGGKLVYIGNSGPGPKTLVAGDANMGWFGEVTDTQLFGISQLASAANLYQGDDNTGLTPGSNHWLKFIWNGKIIYIAKRPFRANVSWADLYASGLVYGTRDTGKYPLATTKHQFVQMPKYEGEKLWVLKPRLIKAYDVDPVLPANVGTYTGEWSQLLGRCSVATDGGITPKFATMTYAALGWTNSSPDSVTMETLSNNVNQCNVRGDGASGQIMGAYRTILKTDRVSGTTGHYWRPVLELIPDAEAKDPYQLLYKAIGPFAPAINDVHQWSGGAIRPVSPHQQNWAYQLPQVTYSFSGQALKVSAVRGTSESPTLKGFTITGSYVA